MSLTDATWITLLEGADESGDLGRKAAYAIAAESCLAYEIEDKDVYVTPGRSIITWDTIGKQYGGGFGTGSAVLRDVCASLDGRTSTVNLLGLWDLDMGQRGVILGALARYLGAGA